MPHCFFFFPKRSGVEMSSMYDLFSVFCAPVFVAVVVVFVLFVLLLLFFVLFSTTFPAICACLVL